MIIQRKAVYTAFIIAMILAVQPIVFALAQGDGLGSVDKIADVVSSAVTADMMGIFGLLALVLVLQSVGAIMFIRSNGSTVNGIVSSLQIVASGNDQNVDGQKGIQEAIEKQTTVMIQEGKIGHEQRNQVADSVAHVGIQVNSMSQHLETLTAKMSVLSKQISELQDLVAARNTDETLNQKMSDLLAQFKEIAAVIDALKPPPPPPDKEPETQLPPSKTQAKVLQADATVPAGDATVSTDSTGDIAA